MALTLEVRLKTRGNWRLKLCLFMMRVVVEIMAVLNRVWIQKKERPGTVVVDLTIGGRARLERSETDRPKCPPLGSMPA